MSRTHDTRMAHSRLSGECQGGKILRIVHRGIAIILAVLSLAGSALAAPVETVLYRFTGGSDGIEPLAGLIADEEGALYGTTQFGGGTGNGGIGFGTVFKLTPPAKGQTAWKETVLYRFTGGSPGGCDGSEPLAGLIADKEGALYGTTQFGGGTGINSGITCGGNCGTVFKLTPPAKGQTTWKETVLYRFTGGSDGIEPLAGLIADEEGALYGTTQFGGGTGNGGIGFGTVFKLTPPAKGQTAWKETVLYRFTGGSPGGSDGDEPRAGLLADKEGALYGTTQSGGGTINCNGNCGTVFKLTPPAKGQTAWKETVLYRFTGGSDGFEPLAGLIADEEGALYGTTQSGGELAMAVLVSARFSS